MKREYIIKMVLVDDLFTDKTRHYHSYKVLEG